MKVAVIGSRNIIFEEFGKILPEKTDEIVSGGAKGIDTCAKKYALENNIKITEFLPNYNHYGRGAPLRRNIEIIEYADYVIALWDGKSKGTEFVIKECKKRGKKVDVHTINISDT